MVTIKKFVNDVPCFATGSSKDCVLVTFKDRSFSGVLCWNALLQAIKRKTTENEKAESDQKAENEIKTKNGDLHGASNPAAQSNAPTK